MNPYLAKLKSEKHADRVLPKLTKPPFDSFDSGYSGRLGENADPPPFDRDHWRQAIITEAGRACRVDGGALSYCADYVPQLHRAALAAGRELDAAFLAEDADRCRAAITAHRKACDATTRAHQRPRTAQSLSAAECDRFCAAHRQQRSGDCPHTGKLDGCLLWQAKNKNLPLVAIPIDPRRYLAAHHV